MIRAIIPASRWSRLRLVVSWFVWLAVYLRMFRADAGILLFMLVGLAGVLRPAPTTEATHRQRLGGAIAALVVIPLSAVLLGSESAMTFLRTAPGVGLLVAAWVASVVVDLRFYRGLPPFFHADQSEACDI